jgi:hypothetical protein
MDSFSAPVKTVPCGAIFIAAEIQAYQAVTISARMARSLHRYLVAHSVLLRRKEIFMTHDIGGLSNYYAQLAAQQQQGTQGTQGPSEANIQQWLANFLSGGSSTSSQTTGTTTGTSTCSGASSSNSNVNWQNLIQAQGTDGGAGNSGDTTQTASTDPTTTTTPAPHHHQHHGGGGAGGASQAG